MLLTGRMLPIPISSFWMDLILGGGCLMNATNCNIMLGVQLDSEGMHRVLANGTKIASRAYFSKKIPGDIELLCGP